MSAVLDVDPDAAHDPDLTHGRTGITLQVSTTEGRSWQDVGRRSVDLVTPGRVPSTQRPVTRAFTWPVALPHTWCFHENQPLVRAVLTRDGDSPTPGAADPAPDSSDRVLLEARIQPTTSGVVLADLVAELGDPLPKHLLEQLDLDQQLELAEPAPLPLGELATAYLRIGVEPHRFAFGVLRDMASGTGPRTDQSSGSGDALSDLADVDVDLPAALAALAGTRADARYENLAAVGYDPVEGALVAVVTTRRAHGYGGGACTAGSTEYVSFWIGPDGQERCAGVAEVTVHDHEAPPDGIGYAAVLPLEPDVLRSPREHRSDDLARPGSGQEPVETQVRAVLSWEEQPSTTDPCWLPVWGHVAHAWVADLG